MGGANHICSDKTGTLTLNKMKVVRMSFGKDQAVENLSIGNLDESPHRDLIFEAIACNTYGFDVSSATDIALVKFIGESGADV